MNGKQEMKPRSGREKRMEEESVGTEREPAEDLSKQKRAPAPAGLYSQ
jgi:hypothetical protein